MTPFDPSTNDFFGDHQPLSRKTLNRWKLKLKTLDSDRLKNRIERKRLKKQKDLSRKINKK